MLVKWGMRVERLHRQDEMGGQDWKVEDLGSVVWRAPHILHSHL